MDDKEYKRFKLLFGIAWFLILILLLAILFKLNGKDIQQNIYPTTKITQKGDAFKYEDFTPEQLKELEDKVANHFRQPEDGKNSISTNTVEKSIVDGSIKTETIIKESVPVKGDKGDRGEKPEFEVEPDTCLLKQKFPSDDGWTYLAQFPKPCVVQ